MPRRDPFTSLCRSLSPFSAERADLHLHTTYSDGAYTPAQLVELAQRLRLAAIAVTDHDTCAGVAPTRQAAAGTLEIIAGVEITCVHNSQELHLLGYFVDVDNDALLGALGHMREHRLNRFQEMRARLAARGVTLHWTDQQSDRGGTLGRRHLAELLVQAGHVKNVRQAFHRFLADEGAVHVPKQCLPVGEAISLVHQAGGVASWAHPHYTVTRNDIADVKSLGLDAVEVEFPACKAGRSRVLRSWCCELGLAVSAGSDCHGPDSPRAVLGAHTVTTNELERLRPSFACV